MGRGAWQVMGSLPMHGAWVRSISGQGTRPHMPQQRSKIPQAKTKTQYSQIYIYIHILNDNKGVP